MSGRLTAIGVVCFVLAWAIPAVAQDSDAQRFWGQWRGPDANGVARYGDPPTEWSETKNIRWKVEIPGRGSASPIVWQSRGTTMNAIPSAVHADGIVYVMSGYRGNNLQAIRLADASGDIASTEAIIWQLDRDTPYVPSPLLYDDALYVIKSNAGILSVFDPLTGEPHYQRQRLQGVPNVFASPVGAAGRVYIAGRDGTTLVIRHGDQYEALASNTLDDGFDASPAIVDDEIYMRGYRYLYAIAEE